MLRAMQTYLRSGNRVFFGSATTFAHHHAHPSMNQLYFHTKRQSQTGKLVALKPNSIALGCAPQREGASQPVRQVMRQVVLSVRQASRQTSRQQHTTWGFSMRDSATSSGEPIAYQICEWSNGNAVNGHPSGWRFDSRLANCRPRRSNLQLLLFLTLVQIPLSTNF